jgi:small-conductance mechanosensitive channel
MQDDDTEMPQSVRNYEKRLYRHRQLYWQALLPSVLVIGAGYALGYLMEALLLALLGVTIVMLVMLREMIDVLGYLGVQQREAALSREALRRELVGTHIDPRGRSGSGDSAE